MTHYGPGIPSAFAMQQIPHRLVRELISLPSELRDGRASSEAKGPHLSSRRRCGGVAGSGAGAAAESLAGRVLASRLLGFIGRWPVVRILPKPVERPRLHRGYEPSH